VVLNKLCCGATTLSAKAALSAAAVVTNYKRQKSQVLARLAHLAYLSMIYTNLSFPDPHHVAHDLLS